MSYGTSHPAQVTQLRFIGMLIVPGTYPVPKSAARRVSMTKPPSPSTRESVWRSARAGCGNPPRIRGPSLFSFFITAKYFGGSGWPASTLFTNSSSDRAWNAQLNRFS